MTIGEKIRELRVRKGFSQENMADELGMSTTNYSYIESGKVNLTIPKLEKVAKILEMDIFEILSLGEKNIFYIPQHTETGINNGYVINNSTPNDYQMVLKENEFLKEKIKFLETENENLKKINALLEKK